MEVQSKSCSCHEIQNLEMNIFYYYSTSNLNFSVFIMIFVKNAAFVVLCRVWPSSPPCRVWRTTTSSRRRCPSRFWSTRLTGHTFSFCFSFTLSYQLTSRNLSSTIIWKISTLFPQAGTKAKMQIVNTFFFLWQVFLHRSVLCAGEEVEWGSGSVWASAEICQRGSV